MTPRSVPATAAVLLACALPLLAVGAPAALALPVGPAGTNGPARAAAPAGPSRTTGHPSSQAGDADDANGSPDIVPFSGSDCPSGSLCLYRDADQSGGGLALRANDIAPRLDRYGFAGQMSSWSNDTGADCVWTDAPDGQGAAHVMRRGYRITVAPRENDTASSVYCA